MTEKQKSFVHRYWNRTELGRAMIASSLVSDSDLLFLIPNNIKKMHGLPVTRMTGKKKKKQKEQRKKFILFSKLFDIIENMVEETLCSKLSDNKFFDKFVDVKDFSTEFPTWIIAFCPDSDSWFVTNQRFFYYEYDKEFETEEEGIKFFKNNPKIFYDEEIRMGTYKPSFYKDGVWLDNTREFIKI